jgi:hypothetical protein
MNQAPGATFELSIDWGSTGATLGARILDNAGATHTARFTGFTEYPAGSGVYYKTGVTAPSTSGQYTILYDDDGGTAAVGHTAVEELNVTTSAITVTAAAGLYVTLAALKATLSITATTWNDDLTAAIAAASRAIDEECGRRFYADDDATSVRYYTPTVASHLTIDDLADITSVYIDTAGTGSYTTLWTAGTHFHLSPYNAAEDGCPYTELEVRGQSGATLPCYTKSVKITGQYGWPTVPNAIAQATGILAARLFKRAREAPFSVFGMGVDGSAVRISRTDPDVAMLVKPFSRNRMIL